jgi:hypothetical protein
MFIKLSVVVIATFLFGSAFSREQSVPARGASISYRLPTSGPLPRTYRVTLAVTDPTNPDSLISSFVAGAPRTVTENNGGRFTEVWNGLDDNFMPVPAGHYGVKGIYMDAAVWPVDGQYHSIVAKYLGASDSWAPPPGQDSRSLPVSGDPVTMPLADIGTTETGSAVFYFRYLENANNQYAFDLTKPIDAGQVITGYPSWGAGGGSAVTTDGQSIWSYGGNISSDLNINGDRRILYRADGKPFGNATGLFRKNVYLPAGWVTGLASWRNPQTGQSFVYAGERGKIVAEGLHDSESDTSFVNAIVVLNGQNGAELSSLPIFKPRALALRAQQLYVLHEAESGSFVVSKCAIENGIPDGHWKKLLAVPAGIAPAGIAADSHGAIYLSDSDANKVFKFSANGKLALTYGHLNAQKPGSYDRLTFIAPEKLASWTDADGHDRLLVLEGGGPNRVSEWSDDGRLLREWMVAQTKANGGYAVDPRHPDLVYVPGQRDWLDRFRIDYKTGKWETDAVWPQVVNSVLDETNRFILFNPRITYRGDTRYLAFGYGYSIYRQQGDQWIAAAGLVSEKNNNQRSWFIWRDENGDGKVEPEEYRGNLTTPPKGTLRYFGETWLDDLSLVAIGYGTADIWRLAPNGFDQHGNPIFDPQGWRKIITDPIFAAKQAGNPGPLDGGNEVADRFDSDWAMITGSMADGFYVNARGGPSFSANYGGQVKVSRYVPDGKGGFKLKWRTGRSALNGAVRPGEIYGSIFVDPPINGILGVTDQTRAGYVLYTTEGLYVDTLFGDGRGKSVEQLGMYLQPGEFFAGHDYLDSVDGKIRLAWGKTEAIIFDIDGWSATQSPVHRLTGLPASITLDASQIAPAAQYALKIRGQGPSAHPLEIVAARPGGPAFDGSMSGWDSAQPITIDAGSGQTITARCAYDSDHLYVRWDVKLGRKFEPRELEPHEQMFIHDREADTVSLYLQGDPRAQKAKSNDGRPGDVRFVFGLFKDHGRVAPDVLGVYPKWYGPGAAAPMEYRTPVGTVDFGGVTLLSNIKLASQMDSDGKGFVIEAAIPRQDIPTSPLLTGGLKTTINFEATLNGRNKMWWSNADDSASRETSDAPSEARLYPNSWAPAHFLPSTERK